MTSNSRCDLLKHQFYTSFNHNGNSGEHGVMSTSLLLDPSKNWAFFLWFKKKKKKIIYAFPRQLESHWECQLNLKIKSDFICLSLSHVWGLLFFCALPKGDSSQALGLNSHPTLTSPRAFMSTSDLQVFPSLIRPLRRGKDAHESCLSKNGWS